MPISPEISVPNQRDLIFSATIAYNKALEDNANKPEIQKAFIAVYPQIKEAIKAGRLPDWKGRKVSGINHDGLNGTHQAGTFEVHDPRVRDGLTFQGEILTMGKIDRQLPKAERFFQIFMACCNCSGRIRPTLSSLAKDIAKLSLQDVVSLNICLNNCEDGSLQTTLKSVETYIAGAKNVEINLYHVSDKEVFDKKRGLSCTCTVQNAMIVDQQAKRSKAWRQGNSYVVLYDDDIILKPRADSCLAFLSDKFIQNPSLKVASGSFAALPFTDDPFYTWANAHKTPKTLALQEPKPTPYGALSVMKANEIPESLLPTGTFSVNDIFLYHFYIDQSARGDETLGTDQWPSFAFPEVVFYHPGEKDIYDWVRAKRQTVAIFESGQLESLFDPNLVRRIREAKLCLLERYRESVRTSLERTYGTQGTVGLNTFGNIFIYDYLLPKVIDQKIYH